MKTPSNDLALAVSAICLVGAAHSLPAWAGTPGAYMSSTGTGKAIAKITFGALSSTATSAVMNRPCAGVNSPADFVCGTKVNLPAGTPAGVYCQARGFPNFVWSIQSFVTGGATADAPELQSMVDLEATPCASYSVNTSAVIPNPKTALITVDASATVGAAVWVRVIEFFGEGEPEDLEDLKENGQAKANILMNGPFDTRETGCQGEPGCPGLPVLVQATTTVEKLYLVLDAAAVSVPLLEILSPGTVIYGPKAPLVDPVLTTTGGCGQVNVTFNPPISQLRGGYTTVTATATDEAGTTAQCTFRALRQITSR